MVQVTAGAPALARNGLPGCLDSMQCWGPVNLWHTSPKLLLLGAWLGHWAWDGRALLPRLNMLYGMYPIPTCTTGAIELMIGP